LLARRCKAKVGMDQRWSKSGRQSRTVCGRRISLQKNCHTDESKGGGGYQPKIGDVPTSLRMPRRLGNLWKIALADREKGLLGLKKIKGRGGHRISRTVPKPKKRVELDLETVSTC